MAKIQVAATTPPTEAIGVNATGKAGTNTPPTTNQPQIPPQIPTNERPADGGIKPVPTTPGQTNAPQTNIPQGNIPNGNAYGWWRNHGQTNPNQGNLPVYDLPIFVRTNHGHHEDFDYGPEHREDRDDERYWQDRMYNANRANLRRDVIRDYIQENLRTAITENNFGLTDKASLQDFGRSLTEALARLFNDPEIMTERTIKFVTHEVSHLLTTRDFNPRSQSVIPLAQANQIANLVLQSVKTYLDPGTKNLNSTKILDGLIFLQLCGVPGKHFEQVQKIMGHKPSVLPEGIPWSVFRNTGLLAANLMREGAAVRTPTDLDAAVRRFVKLLVANNELGILLAAVKLSADARMGAVPASRVLALVQIYQLIAQLLVTAERAMKEAALNQRPPELMKTDRGLVFSDPTSVDDAEVALRRYLEFNPGARADSFASAFFSEDLGENASRIAVEASQQALEEWLRSGRHRFVYDADLGEPLGIVLDKQSDECFVASTIRVVLLRDASAIGWRMFRSFLVA